MTSEQKASPARMREVREIVSNCMDEILSQFRPGAKITVLVRTPGNDDADFMLTSDQMPDIAAMIKRTKGYPES